MNDNQVFVIWNWTWLAAEDIESSDGEKCLSESDSIQSAMDNSEDESDGIPAITHSVVFGALGVIKRTGIKNYWHLLKEKEQGMVQTFQQNYKLNPPIPWIARQLHSCAKLKLIGNE